MKRQLAGSLVFVLTAALMSVGVSDVLARSAKINGQFYLSYNVTQQSIYVNGLMDGESELIEQCAPDATAEDAAKALTEFLRANPQYLQRPAHLAFRQLLVQTCKGVQ